MALRLPSVRLRGAPSDAHWLSVGSDCILLVSLIWAYIIAIGGWRDGCKNNATSP